MNRDDPEIIYSPLCRRIRRNRTTVQVQIYRTEIHPEWAIEVVDETGTSTVWTETFASDADALDEVMSVVEKEGIEAFVKDEHARH